MVKDSRFPCHAPVHGMHGTGGTNGNGRIVPPPDGISAPARPFRLFRAVLPDITRWLAHPARLSAGVRDQNRVELAFHFHSGGLDTDLR